MFLIDQSCSMNEEQSQLANGFSGFVSHLQQHTTDWQVMVVNADDGCNNSGVLTPTTSEFHGQFTNAIASAGGSYTEALLTVAANAIEATDPTECNHGFMRPNALLHIVMVSDEPEQSALTWDNYVNQITTKKGDPTLTVFSAIAGDYPNGCSTADPGAGYYEAVMDTGGQYLSICATDWIPHMSSLAGVSENTAPSRVLQLAYIPYEAASIIVTRNGNLLSNAWSYNQPNNTVILDQAPLSGDEIIISYTRDVACPTE